MQAKRDFQPFLKWVGGKRGLLSQIMPSIPKEFNSYFEPFLGGGALFFELFSQGKLTDKNIYLFDLNSELINAYIVVRDTPSDLIKKLKDFANSHSKEFYYKVRNLDREDNFSKLDPVDRATRFIYLNKTCFNGLYRVNRNNQNNVPIGSYKNPNICDKETITGASIALQGAKIFNLSYKEVLNYAKKDDFIYLDPPYFPLTKSANFTAYSRYSFDANDQLELFDVFEKLAQKKAIVLHSNSYTEFILDLYKNYKITEIFANRFINSNSAKRGKISELLIESS